MATEAARRWIMTVATPMGRTGDFDREAAVALLGYIYPNQTQSKSLIRFSAESRKLEHPVCRIGTSSFAD
jgi:hypothetical protein